MNASSRYTIADLVYLMQRLRDPQTGCPWDLKQTCQSIVPSTLEEVYEVVDAIERGDTDNLREELGDLLFQVVFYSQMARESAWFDFEDVAHAIVAKLVRRHPHVFPTGQLYGGDAGTRPLSDAELHAQWEAIKQEEKRSGKPVKAGLLSDVPAAIPALQRAYKLQKKMASVNFDWSSPQELFPVIESELAEVHAAMADASPEHLQEELGDVLFAVVNLCRQLKVDPETALRASNHKVEQRFGAVERELQRQGKTLDMASLGEMEALWQKAKRSQL